MAHNDLRPFRVDVYDLQDHFIKSLKDVGVELQGEMDSLSMTISDDGTQELSFNIPMFIRKDGVLVENPLWCNVIDNTLLINLRKIKVIFNPQEGYNAGNVFEFIINKITESHNGGILSCSVNGEGLAFQELGKTGYTLNFSKDSYLLEYEAALDAGETAPEATINYWMDQVVEGTAWNYEITMNYDDDDHREDSKIYEDPYVVSWKEENNKLVPEGYSTYTEKCRIVECSESNRYNITQDIAEAFEVKCKYVYTYDDNCHIIGRNIIFFNELVNEDPTQVIDINYFFNASNITRENDSTDVITKLYVTDIDDDDTVISIADVGANKTGENYILNFDYLYDIGAITEEQYAAVDEFENNVGILNKTLIAMNNKISSYTSALTKAKASKTVAENGMATNLETLNESNDILSNYNELYYGTTSPTKGTKQRLITVATDDIPSWITEIPSHFEVCRYSFTAVGLDVDSINEVDSLDDSMIYRVPADENPVYNEDTNLATVYFFARIENRDPDSDDDTNSSNDEEEEEYKTYTHGGYSILTVDYTSDYISAEKAKNSVAAAQYAKCSADYATACSNINFYSEVLDEYDPDYSTAENPKGLNQLYTEKLAEKKSLVAAFERFMGPAIREGSWSDEEYEDTGSEKKAEDIDFNDDFASKNQRQYISGTSNLAFYKWDTNTFDGEEQGYYNADTTGAKVYYPYFSLTNTFTTNNETLLSVIKDADALDSFQLSYGGCWKSIPEEQGVARLLETFKNTSNSRYVYNKTYAESNPYENGTILYEANDSVQSYFKFVGMSDLTFNGHDPSTETSYWTSWPYDYDSTYTYRNGMFISYNCSAPSGSNANIYYPIPASKNSGYFYSSNDNTKHYEKIWNGKTGRANTIHTSYSYIDGDVNNQHLYYQKFTKGWNNIKNVSIFNPSVGGKVTTGTRFVGNFKTLAIGDLIAFKDDAIVQAPNSKKNIHGYVQYELAFKQIIDIDNTVGTKYYTSDNWILARHKENSANATNCKWVKIVDINCALSNIGNRLGNFSFSANNDNPGIKADKNPLLPFSISTNNSNLIINICSTDNTTKVSKYCKKSASDSEMKSYNLYNITQKYAVPNITMTISNKTISGWRDINTSAGDRTYNTVNTYNASVNYKYGDYVKFTSGSTNYVAFVNASKINGSWPDVIPAGGYKVNNVNVFIPVTEDDAVNYCRSHYKLDYEWDATTSFNTGDMVYYKSAYYTPTTDNVVGIVPTNDSTSYRLGIGSTLIYGMKHWSDTSKGNFGDPIVYITDTTAMAQLRDANTRSIFNANPQLIKISTTQTYKTIDEDGNESNIVSNNLEETVIAKVSDFGDSIEPQQNVAAGATISNPHNAIYPRIGVENMFLKTDDSDLGLSIDDGSNTDVLLEKYSDFTGPLIRTNEQEGNKYYDSYYITPKYETLLKYYDEDDGFAYMNLVFLISNAAEHVYMDALQVSKENAYPQVSYTVDIAATNFDFLQHAYQKLSNVCNINDYMLKLNEARGYISSITISPAAPWEDKITINNYKTKYEDLFASIVASTEAMKSSSTAYDRAASAFTSGGALTQETLDKSLSNNDVHLDNVDIISENQFGGAVALRQGGFFVASEPTENSDYEWEQIIGPDGINAKLIKAGQLDTSKIRIMSGDDVSFQWVNDGLYAFSYDTKNSKFTTEQYIKFNGQGLSYVNGDGYTYYDSTGILRTLHDEVKRIEIGWNGLHIRDVENNELMYFDDSGNLQIKYANIEDCYIGSLRVGDITIQQCGIKPLKGTLVRFNAASEITVPAPAVVGSGSSTRTFLTFSVEATNEYSINSVTFTVNPGSSAIRTVSLVKQNSLDDFATNGGWYYGDDSLHTLYVDVLGNDGNNGILNSDNQFSVNVIFSKTGSSSLTGVSELINVERSENTTIQVVPSNGTQLIIENKDSTILFADIKYGSTRISLAEKEITSSSEQEAIALLKSKYGDNVKLQWYYYDDESEAWTLIEVADTSGNTLKQIVLYYTVQASTSGVNISKYKCKLFIDTSPVEASDDVSE